MTPTTTTTIKFIEASTIFRKHARKIKDGTFRNAGLMSAWKEMALCAITTSTAEKYVFARKDVAGALKEVRYFVRAQRRQDSL
tara:strand:+ start:174 stop:422 length:249 start_codon:yes stop_codon:yes gene_type:complete